MNAYAHNYLATLEGEDYVLTLHCVALGNAKFAETLSVAEAEIMRPLEVFGHMGETWGLNGLHEMIRKLVAIAYARNHSPYQATEERVARLAERVAYSETSLIGAHGTVEESR